MWGAGRKLHELLPENELRQRVARDVSLDAGNFDVVIISAYEIQIRANSDWIAALDAYFEQLSEEARNAHDLENISRRGARRSSSRSGSRQKP